MRYGVLLGIGLLAGLGAAFSQESAREEAAVTPVQSDAAKEAGIPALDRSVPEKLETATFALG